MMIFYDYEDDDKDDYDNYNDDYEGLPPPLPHSPGPGGDTSSCQPQQARRYIKRDQSRQLLNQSLICSTLRALLCQLSIWNLD